MASFTAPPGTAMAKLIMDFEKLPNDHKLEFLKSAMEFIGGTAGAALTSPGIVTSPLGAAVGSATGRAVGEGMGRALGYSPDKARTVGEVATEYGTTAALGAAGEAVGRVLPVGLKLAKNIVKRPFQPSAAHAKLVALADKHGIPLNIAERSGNRVMIALQSGLDRFPFSTGIMQDEFIKKYELWRRAMDSLLDQVRVGRVSSEEFTDMADQSLRRLRNDLESSLTSQGKRALDQAYPRSVSDIEVGEALKGGRSQNVEALRQWSKSAYGAIKSKIGDAPIDLQEFADKGSALMESIPEELQKQFFPSSITSRLGKAARMGAEIPEEALAARDSVAKQIVDKNTTYESLDTIQRAKIDGILEKLGISTEPVPHTITGAEAIALRSELLDYASRAGRKGARKEQRVMLELVDGLNSAMESSLASDPSKTASLKKLKAINETYRSKMELLYGPRESGKAGSVAAQTIKEENIPEALPRKVTASPTMYEQASRAVDPGLAQELGGQNVAEAIPQLQRNIGEKVLEESRVVIPETGGRRLSPARIAEELPPVPGGGPTPSRAEYVLPPPVQSELRAMGSPRNIETERMLYRSPFATAVGRERGGPVMVAAFPAKSPAVAQETLGVMGKAGKEPETKRAFGDWLLDTSETRARELDDRRFTDPRKFEQKLGHGTGGYGETVPAVLGYNLTEDLSELNKLGKVVTRPELMNPSGTAKTLEAIQAAGALGEAVLRGFGGDLLPIPEVVGTIMAVPYASAKAFSSPRLAKWLTSPLSPVTPRGPVSGAMGRAAMMTLPPPAGQPARQDTRDDSSLIAPRDDSDLIAR